MPHSFQSTTLFKGKLRSRAIMWSSRRASRKFLSVIPQRQFHTPSKPVSVLQELTQRGFIQDVTRRDVLANAIKNGKQTIYAGVDPTAKSLHIGHLIPLLALLHFHLRGHKIIPLIGGATGRVGDPSGRLVERQLADIEQVDDNAASLTASIQTFFRRALMYASSRVEVNHLDSEPQVVNNLEWHKSFSLLDFLYKVGSNVRINTMLNRESVSARLSSQQGLNFTEFTYQLLQAYDFHHLNRHFGCSIQVGGSDQWGNIVAGLDLIGKLRASEAFGVIHAPEAFGMTTPLLTTSTGEKFGKSAGNAIWLDQTLTSVFDFYQYFLKVTDADVGKYLKLFTLLSNEEIGEIEKAHEVQPEKRLAQSRLATEITEMVHMKSGVLQAITKTNLLFGSDYSKLTTEDIVSAFQDDPRLIKTTLQELTNAPLGKLAAKYGLVSSNSASRALIASRGLYLNGRVVPTVQDKIEPSDLINGTIAVLRAGKDKVLILMTVEE